MSSGFGPFTASTTIRGRRRPSAKLSQRAASGKGTPPSKLDGLVEGLELANSVMLLIDYAASRHEAKRLASDSARAAKLLTTAHLEDFPEVTAPVAPSASRRWRRFGRVDHDEQAALDTDYEQDLARWEALRRHDPSEVIATVDDALADNASLSACIDAGTSPTGNYVTLVVHYPGPEIVQGVIQVGSKTRPRTDEEIIDIYGDAIASTVVATAKEALAYAPAADEAYVVVLRYDARGWFSKKSTKLDAIYAGALDRHVLHIEWEAHNPYNVMLGARAVRVNLDHKGRFKPLGDRAGDDLHQLVASIAATSMEGLKDRSKRHKFTQAESREKMRVQERDEFKAICACPGCGEIGAHALRRPIAGEPTWAKTIRSCTTCNREWAQC